MAPLLPPFPLLLLLLLLLAPSALGTLEASLLLHYRMEETSGTVVTSETGMHHGTLVNTNAGMQNEEHRFSQIALHHRKAGEMTHTMALKWRELAHAFTPNAQSRR